MIMERTPAGLVTFTRERVALAPAGLAMMVFPLLAWLHSPWWLVGSLAIGLNMIQASFSGLCVFNYLLKCWGVPGEREVGRAEAAAAAPRPPLRAERRRLPGTRHAFNRSAEGGGF